MGEAKWRKARDPKYGASKRGLVVSHPVTIDGTSLFAKSSSLDPQELRYAVLFWDQLVWPKSRSIYFAGGPDEEFLQNEGILSRPDYTVDGDVAQGIAYGQIQAFLDLDKREPGKWALAQGETSLLLKGQLIHAGNGTSVELHRAIPVPDADVPLDEVLEFKNRRDAELTMLRAEIDAMASLVGKAEDRVGALAKHVALIDAACADAIKVGKEWRFPVKLTNVKMSLDLKPSTSIAAGLVGFGAGSVFGLPAATSLLFGAAASVKISGDFALQGVRPRSGPYRYVCQFHNELF